MGLLIYIVYIQKKYGKIMVSLVEEQQQKDYDKLKKDENTDLDPSYKKYLIKTCEFFGNDERKFLEESIGEDGLVIIGILMNGGVDYKELGVTPEEISEKTNLRLNKVRKRLYKLDEYRLASYIRTKNKEIGWYYYHWKLDDNFNNKLHNIIISRKKEILDELKGELQFLEDKGAFFICKNDEFKIPFDEASESNFKCSECSSPLEYTDKESTIKSLGNKISKIQEEIGV